MIASSSRKVVLLFAAYCCFLLVAASEEERVFDDTTIWQEGSSGWDIFQYLNCDDGRPQDESSVYTTETWKLLQETYTATVSTETSTLPVGGFLGIDGFYVPYYLAHGIHGRGIFAAADIPQGQLIWKSFQTAGFLHAQEYRDFLKKLPRKLACDVCSWAYTRSQVDVGVHDSPTTTTATPATTTATTTLTTKTPMVCVDLDPGSFINACGNGIACNTILREEMWQGTGCQLEFIAAYPIRKGEELRLDYSFSELRAGWIAMGLRAAPVATSAEMGEVYEEDEDDEEEEYEEDEDDEEEYDEEYKDEKDEDEDDGQYYQQRPRKSYSGEATKEEEELRKIEPWPTRSGTEEDVPKQEL